MLVIKRTRPGRVKLHVMKAEGRADDFQVRFAKNTYSIEPSAAFLLKGWDPTRPKDWFSTLTDLLPVFKVGMLYYMEPRDMQGKRLEGMLVHPIDRLAGRQLSTEQTPFLLRVFSSERLFTKWIRRLSFGFGVSAKFVIIMLLVLLALLAILWFGGYYG
jgi:hypothetical protein